MTTMMRWEPLSDLYTMSRAMDRLFGENSARVENLPVDIYQQDDALLLRAPVPGVDPSDVEVTLHEDVLTIRGQSKLDDELEDGNFRRRELRYGSFSRSIRLPAGMQSEKAEASFDKGMLTVRIPLPEKAQPRKLEITVH